MSLTDTHCHLDQLEDVATRIEEAARHGVTRIVAVSMDVASMRRVLELRSRFPHTVLTGLGIHPQNVPAMDDAAIEEALAFLQDHLAAADLLGEVGLDFLYASDATQQARQRDVLERQLDLAARLRKPANFHCRRAERATLEAAIAFTARTGLGAQMHWFTHSRKLVRLANEAGVYCSAGPSIVFDAAQRAVAAEIARDHLLLETDSPVAYQGAPATPGRLRDVANVIADIWGASIEDMENQLERNFQHFLRGGPRAGAARNKQA